MPGPDVSRALQPGAAADLRTLIHHYSTVAHVEHHAGLDGRAERHHLSRIAEHHTSLGNTVAWCRHEIGAIGSKEGLESGQQVVGSAEPDTLDFQGGSVFVRISPLLTIRHHPANSFFVVSQPAYGRIRREGRAGGREPGSRDDCRTHDSGWRP